MTKRTLMGTRRRPVRTDAPAPDRGPWRALGWRGLASGALSGLLAAAVALGVAELIAGITGITGPLGSPVVAVGGAAIDMTPIPVKDFAIAHFGSHDKTALITGIFVLLAIFAVVIGALARRWLAAGLAGLTIFLPTRSCPRWWRRSRRPAWSTR
jgi:hypothetical protein